MSVRDDNKYGNQQVSKRGNIDSFIAMDVLARANALERQGAAVIHMEVGQPSTPAPGPVLDAARAALSNDRIGYTEAVGILPLRERISRHYRETYGLEIGANRVIVTTGSSAGFILSFLALLDEGARVGLVSPGYPCYRHILSSLGNEAAIIETDEASRWAPRPEDILKAHTEGPLGALLIASPANPTGTMLSADRLEAVIRLCDAQGIRFISDEIYHGLTYQAPGRSALEFSDDAIVINSFSKYFSMTGWRVGWMVVPDDLVRRVESLAQNLFISAPTLSQLSAVAAFDAVDEVTRYRDQYHRNRDILLDGLSKAGIREIAPADGAFYVYADISNLTEDSQTFCNLMLDDVQVATTPGLDFDAARGQRFVRFSYAGSEPDMVEAVRRIGSWLSA